MKQSWAQSLRKIGMFRIALVILAGIVLVLCSIPLPTSKEEAADMGEPVQTKEAAGQYELGLEERLETILEQVEGIESVKVMITLYSGSEKIVDKEETAKTQRQSETSADGGVAEHSSVDEIHTTVLTGLSGGNQEPYVIKELAPVIQGVLVVAGGNLTAEKVEQINGAVQALFGIEAHKVRVLEKKKQAEG